MRCKHLFHLLVLVLSLAAVAAAQAADGPGRAGLQGTAENGNMEEKMVVIDLIEAFRAGDREKVESLWARDGGTWTDDEGFRKRAAHFREAEFDLDPSSIVVYTGQGTPQVCVFAEEDGKDYVWSFLVAEIDGRLRAGGMQVSLKGLP